MSILSYDEIKIIPEYSFYGITEYGDVYSKKATKRWKRLLPATYPDGYKYVTLRKYYKAKPKKEKIHRLVLMAFDRMPKEGEICRHLDGSKDNNHISNLKWGTHQENAYDAIYTHKVSTIPVNQKLSDQEVIEIRKLHDAGVLTQLQLSVIYGVCRRHINNVVKRRLRV